jgi:hypothetical protein
MGYTHYFTQKRDFTAAEWQTFTDGVKGMIKSLNRPKRRKRLVWEYDEVSREPQVDDNLVRFNGCGEDGHETFLVTRQRPALRPGLPDDLLGFAFCKTARKPYDVAVTACLTVLASLGTHEVSSDGEGYEWLDGMDLAVQHWGQLRLVNPIANDNERAA